MVGWAAVTATDSFEVRQSSEQMQGLTEAYVHGIGQRALHQAGLSRRTSAKLTPLAVSAPMPPPRRTPAQVGRSAPQEHVRNVRRRDARVVHPVPQSQRGESVTVSKRFPRFRHTKKEHATEKLLQGSDERAVVGSPVLRRAASARSSQEPRTANAAWPTSARQLPRKAALELAVRGWHEEKKGTPGAAMFLAAGLAGQPSPLGGTSSTRPSSVGGQGLRTPRAPRGESAPVELDRNLPSPCTAIRAKPPSEMTAAMMRSATSSECASMRLNDKGTGLRSQHRYKRAIDCSPWSMTMFSVALTHREWVAAARVIQERFRLNQTMKMRTQQNDAAGMLQKVARGKLARLAQQARKRAAVRIQSAQRGHVARRKTCKERAALRAEREARKRREAAEQVLHSMNATKKAGERIMKKKSDRDDRKAEEEKQRAAKRLAARLEKMSLEQAKKEAELELAAEEARMELEKKREAMVCFGAGNPFTTDEHEKAAFVRDCRTGRVIRCTDGITRVAYSLEEAQRLIMAQF